MCLIFQYLRYTIKFDGDLFNCCLVNSKWLYHVWNPNSIYFVDLTKLINGTYKYVNKRNDTNYNYGLLSRQWQRFIQAKHILIQSLNDHDLDASNEVCDKQCLQMFETIVSRFVHIKQVSIIFHMACDASIMLFWQLLNPIIEKTNSKVIVKHYYWSHEKIAVLNEKIDEKKLKVDKISRYHGGRCKKRLQYEFDMFELNPIDGIHVSMVGDNIFHWRAVLRGPSGSPYANQRFVVDINVAPDCPVHPPKVIMKTPIDHVNINSHGNFSLHSLMTMNDEWNIQETQIRDILNEIIELLYRPVSKQQLFDRHNKGRSDIATI